MPSKNQVNNKEVLKDLEKKISPILVVNNSSLKPYVELFDYAPENIYQQPLGSLVGFFEIKEYSEDSAYVVNFLTSVLKKEYYINPKRPVTESLDSALHKVNLALSELAKHGNVQWLGKLNASICVLEKNNAHFSVAGNAKIFLYRNTGLTEISEDLAADSTEPHPLKTFVNVSSGRLEKDDRLLITSEDIFHILTTIDLKKNFQRFEGEKFVQFLKTALSNQMEMIASLIVELSEPEIEVPVKSTLKKKTLNTANVFSEKTFVETVAAEKIVDETLSIINPPIEEIEYTDKKTGHIYVQGETSEPSENPQMALYMDSVKEKLGEAWYLTKNETRRRLNIYKKQIAKKIEQRRQEKERLAKLKEEEMERLREEQELLRIRNEERLAEERKAEQILFEQQEIERKEAEMLEQQRNLEFEQKEKQRLLEEEKELAKQKTLAVKSQTKKKIIPKIEDEKIKAEPSQELNFQAKLQQAIREQQQRQAVIDLRAPQKSTESKIEDFFKEDSGEDETLSVPVHQQAEIDEQKKRERIETVKKNAAIYFEKIKNIIANTLDLSKQKFISFTEKRKIDFRDENKSHISPRFSKIKNNFSKFSTKQKTYTLVILALIFIIPFFIARFLNKPEKPIVNQLPTTPLTQAEILSSEKNIKTGIEAKTILSRQDLNGNILITSAGLITFTKSSIVLFDANNKEKEYQIPSGQGSIIKASFMNDLSLVLIITDQNKVISFSPISQKFADNNINLLGKASEDFFGTYMTYMYVLDSAAGQIYRYPRAEGGFGEKTNWLKSQAQFSKASSLAIDDNIYVADGKQIVKFFKGAPQQMKFESSQTSINYDLIYTSIDSTSLYTLDRLNSRIIVFAKDSGNITAQYHSEKLKDSTSFTIDEKNKTAYMTTTSELISISL